MQTWGDSYTGNVSSLALHTFKSFGASEHHSVDGLVSPHLFPHQSQVLFSSQSLTALKWPDANKHPLFYVGVYSAIGMTAGIASIASYNAQYAGALRASRRLFKELLVVVVHATMRWHDTTPQGLFFTELLYLNHCTYSCCRRSHAQSFRQGYRDNR
jgi:hypothetical protein